MHHQDFHIWCHPCDTVFSFLSLSLTHGRNTFLVHKLSVKKLICFLIILEKLFVRIYSFTRYVSFKYTFLIFLIMCYSVVSIEGWNHKRYVGVFIAQLDLHEMLTNHANLHHYFKMKEIKIQLQLRSHFVIHLLLLFCELVYTWYWKRD